MTKQSTTCWAYATSRHQNRISPPPPPLPLNDEYDPNEIVVIEDRTNLKHPEISSVCEPNGYISDKNEPKWSTPETPANMDDDVLIIEPRNSSAPRRVPPSEQGLDTESNLDPFERILSPYPYNYAKGPQVLTPPSSTSQQSKIGKDNPKTGPVEPFADMKRDSEAPDLSVSYLEELLSLFNQQLRAISRVETKITTQRIKYQAFADRYADQESEVKKAQAILERNIVAVENLVYRSKDARYTYPFVDHLKSDSWSDSYASLEIVNDRKDPDSSSIREADDKGDEHLDTYGKGSAGKSTGFKPTQSKLDDELDALLNGASKKDFNHSDEFSESTSDQTDVDSVISQRATGDVRTSNEPNSPTLTDVLVRSKENTEPRRNSETWRVPRKQPRFSDQVLDEALAAALIPPEKSRSKSAILDEGISTSQKKNVIEYNDEEEVDLPRRWNESALRTIISDAWKSGNDGLAIELEHHLHDQTVGKRKGKSEVIKISPASTKGNSTTKQAYVEECNVVGDSHAPTSWKETLLFKDDRQIAEQERLLNAALEKALLNDGNLTPAPEMTNEDSAETNSLESDDDWESPHAKDNAQEAPTPPDDVDWENASPTKVVHPAEEPQEEVKDWSVGDPDVEDPKATDTPDLVFPTADKQQDGSWDDFKTFETGCCKCSRPRCSHSAKPRSDHRKNTHETANAQPRRQSRAPQVKTQQKLQSQHDRAPEMRDSNSRRHKNSGATSYHERYYDSYPSMTTAAHARHTHDRHRLPLALGPAPAFSYPYPSLSFPPPPPPPSDPPKRSVINHSTRDPHPSSPLPPSLTALHTYLQSCPQWEVAMRRDVSRPFPSTTGQLSWSASHPRARSCARTSATLYRHIAAVVAALQDELGMNVVVINRENDAGFDGAGLGAWIRWAPAGQEIKRY